MSFVLVDRPDPQVAVVTLNRPERMNAMAFDVMVPLRDALAEIGQDNEVRAVRGGHPEPARKDARRASPMTGPPTTDDLPRVGGSE